MRPFAMTLHNRLQLAKTQMPLVTRKVQFNSNFLFFVCSLHTIKHSETRVVKNVFHKNKYRCRDGAPDQVAAWKSQPVENV